MIQLQENEKIITAVRRHWFVIAIDVTIFIVLAIIPLFLITAVLNHNLRIGDQNTDYGIIIAFFYSAWLLFAWNVLAVAWTNNYYLDVILITNRRILKIEQLGLFARDISEMRLEKIQDINVKMVGIVPSLLNFGSLKIQTAGEEKEFIMHDIPNPNKIKNIIFEHHDDAITKNTAKFAP